MALAIVAATLLAVPAAGMAAEAPPADSTRLIVRARAGLPQHRRGQLLARHRARVSTELPQIAAATVEVPRANRSRLSAELRRSGAFLVVEEDRKAYASSLPNDPLFGDQWGTAWINAVASWTVTRGAPEAVVAILDTGVDMTHPDLWGQVLSGYDFVNDDVDPYDDHGHGTAMAGIVAALTNNGIGVAGVAPRALLLPIKVLDRTAAGYYSDVAAGVLAATDAGARIINLSLAGAADSATLQSAIDYARAHDVVVVASAGNDGTAEPRYPAAMEGVVAVGATDVGDARTTFSNYGNWLTLTAPGVSIYGPLPPSGYGIAYGTSASAALTSGAFALLRAAHPTLTAEEAIDRMIAGAVDLGAPGRDAVFGFGRIDAYAALVPAQPPPVPTGTTAERPASFPSISIVEPSPGRLVSGIVPVDVETGDDAAIQRVELRVDRALYATAESPPFSFAWDTEGLAPGKYLLRAVAYDTVGNVTRSRPRGVLVTPGDGLLLRKGVLRFGGRPGNDRVFLHCLFTLPEGLPFDPTAETVQVELRSVAGTVLSLNVPAGSMQMPRRMAKFNGLADVPTAGKVRVKVKPGADDLHTLTVTGSNLDLAGVDTEMDLRLVVGGNVVTQPVVFRHRGTKLVSP